MSGHSDHKHAGGGCGHNHDHGHSHGGLGHSHAPASFGKAFAIGVTLNSAYVVAEAVFGLHANSLALVADAGHNLGDVLGLVLAWVAIGLGKRAPSSRRTYGVRKSSILAALFNAIILLVTVGGIAWEAIRRIGDATPVAGKTVIIVSVAGILINAITALMFMSGRKDDLNVRGAYLHMMADAAVSAGVVVAGFIILYTGWHIVDPLVSLTIVVVILAGTWGLLRDSVNMALDAVPEGINIDEVKAYLGTLPGVVGVHDLHIWNMSTTEIALTAHVVRTHLEANNAILAQADTELRKRFRIDHATLQIEIEDPAHECRLVPDHVV